MSKSQQTHEIKALSLSDARKKKSELKSATRVAGSKGGQQVSPTRDGHRKGRI
jgi:hypothetical protein